MEQEEQNSFDLIKLIPNIMTMSALCLGLFAVRLAIIEHYTSACLCVLIACLLDAFDGGIARKLKVASEFGAQMDSLADFFNFGIAPGFVVYFWKMDEFNTVKGLAWAPVLILAICMAIRLARFNVALVNSDKENPLVKYFFQGIPAPMAAMLVLLPMFIETEFGFNITSFYVIMNTTIIALFAAIPIPTPCLKKVKFNNIYKHIVLLGFGILIILLLLKTWLILSLFSIGYIIAIFISWFYYIKFSKEIENAKKNIINNDKK